MTGSRIGLNAIYQLSKSDSCIAHVLLCMVLCE